MIASDIVVPGDPDKSRMWNRVAVRADMPFNGLRLTGPEIQVLRAWMGNLNRPAQKPRTHEQLLDLIVADQAKVRAQGNDHRYISFAHFVDERRSPEEMLAAEQVLGVVINSLSRRAQIVKLEPADPGRSIFRFRLSQLGWDRDDWDRMMEFYPYCLRSDRAAVRAVYDRLGTESPMIRGDWFLATATKPPLYHELLDLPDTLAELEDDLNIDIEDNVNRQPRPTAQSASASAARACRQFNRMIERHRLGNNGGYFWISYDFNDDEDRADLRANPLGPAAIDNQNFNRTFEHAGGEVIYSLPNGMQAYLLLAANGQRLDVAPKEIVKDPRRRAGAVENGISCIGCHGVTGMNRPRVYDEIVKYAEEHRNRLPGSGADGHPRAVPHQRGPDPGYRLGPLPDGHAGRRRPPARPRRRRIRRLHQPGRPVRGQGRSARRGDGAGAGARRPRRRWSSAAGPRTTCRRTWRIRW